MSEASSSPLQEPAAAQDETRGVMIIGGGIGGIQAALDLAESDIKVFLVEQSPSIGGRMAQLDKTFPTNDCSMCILSPKLVAVGRHPNIQLITNSEVVGLEGKPGDFKATIKKASRYVIEDKCTGCGECVAACPVELPNEFDFGLSTRKAIYVPFPQAVPLKNTITKLGEPPCRAACPASINGQGYVALTSAGKFKEALALVKEKAPFPGVLGRICHHPCETECNRREVDEPIAICQLKRFLADYALEHGELAQPEVIDKRAEKVAIIGAGPAGLTAANNLARMGYGVTVFEALPVVGGMLAVGIPDYRLPREILNGEIDVIKALGVEIKTNTPIGKDLTIQNLFDQGYKAIFIATGAHTSMKLKLEGEDLEGVYHGVEFLRDVGLGKKPKLGNKVAVIGGGNVAIDSVRTALRYGSEAFIIYRRSREEMPAYSWEIEEAEEEGIKFHFLATPTKILGKDGKVTGIECIKMELGEPDDSGRRRPVPIEGSEFSIDLDTVIPAIGQLPDTSYSTEDIDLQITKWNTLDADAETLMTNIDGIFAGGDNVLGPASAIDAIAHGNRAADAIDRYLSGKPPSTSQISDDKPVLGYDDLELDADKIEHKSREQPTILSPSKRLDNFNEIIPETFTEAQARQEAERCLNCGICSECMECVKACDKLQAIDHNMLEEQIELKVGAVIVSTGFEQVDPSLKSEYGWEVYDNVITGMELERMMNASGPFGGHVQRISDGENPKKIAFLQCVGSRDEKIGNTYCSTICCMYSTKEAIITKEHLTDSEISIFFMDMRAMGKEFDDYYSRAENDYGIKYIRHRVQGLEETESKSLIIHYIENGEWKTEEFDLVILAMGIKPTEKSKRLSEVLGIELNEHDFCKTRSFTPLDTTKPGVYTVGAISGPKDIPDSVAQASGAAAKAGSMVAEWRGKGLVKKEYPPEKEVEGEPPRIGAFICNCGINIGGVVDVPSVAEYAKTLPGVVYAEHNIYTCSQDTQERIKDLIIEHNLNRVLVAACTPRTHEPLFQSTIREAGLNVYLFEMANIRDQCSWVHSREPEKATAKAKDLIRMGIANANLLQPIKQQYIEIFPTGLVVGGGLAGMTAALELAAQGFDVNLIEKEPELGGNLRNLHYVLGSKEDPKEFLEGLIERINSSDKIKVYTNTELKNVDGHIGDFKVTTIQNDTEELLQAGAIIIATGGVEYTPTEYLYGEDERVVTQLELEDMVSRETGPELKDLNTVVMIQCVGSRDENNTWCSKVCCTEAVKNSLKLKELNPKTKIFVLYKDVRTYGLREDYFGEASRQGVKFIRYDDSHKPEVTKTSDGAIEVTVNDLILGSALKFNPDMLVLSAGIIPSAGNEKISPMLKIPLNKDGFFLEAHMKLRPVDFATEGIFLCGLAHSPKPIDETISQAAGAAARAITILSKQQMAISGVVAVIEEDKCAGCLTCVRVCPYEVPVVNEDGVAEIATAKCQGCGTCVGECPAKAIELKHYRDEQIFAKCDTLLLEVET